MVTKTQARKRLALNPKTRPGAQAWWTKWRCPACGAVKYQIDEGKPRRGMGCYAYGNSGPPCISGMDAVESVRVDTIDAPVGRIAMWRLEYQPIYVAKAPARRGAAA